MPGRKIVLTGVSFTDDTLPRLQDDAILPNEGALMLVEPAHPARAWMAGVPATTVAVPNVAAAQLGALMGTDPDSDTLKPFAQYGAGNGTTWIWERSSKGGLHGLVSPTAITSGHGAALRLPTVLKQYLYDHITNDLYVSLWGRITRDPSINDLISAVAVNPSSGSNRATFWATPTTFVTGPQSGNAEFIGASYPNPRNASDTFLITHGTTTWRNTVPTSEASIAGYHLANWAMGYGSNGSPGNGSWVFYRYYMEDLTVSGRTWAEVAAIDADLFAQKVETAGGRYASDTWTDPAALP